MTNDVFISYSSKDKHIADAVCSTLENGGIRCWIAPRDIFPGSDWAQSIISAIKSCKLMVLIFSHNSNGSSQVTKELNLAISNNLMVVPFKIDDSVPSGSMEYFLADMHWLDAINGDMQDQINKLKEVVSSVLPHNMKTSDNANNSSPDTNKVKNDAGVFVQHDTVKTAPIFENNIINNKADTQNTAPVNSTRRVGLWEAYKLLWQKIFIYSGCATRSEYWKALAANIIVAIIVLVINKIIDPYSPEISALYILASGIPFISLGIRRLHDTNRTGHWMWLMFLGYGVAALLVFFCLPGVTEGNRYKK